MNEDRMRILILNSVDDGLTMQRIMRMDESPVLSKYFVTHSYAIMLNNEQKMLPMEEMMSQIMNGKWKFNKSDLLHRLRKEIIKYNPDVIIVHTGFVFKTFPLEITSILDKLKLEFPDLKIGMQRMKNTYDSEQLADVIDDFF